MLASCCLFQNRFKTLYFLFFLLTRRVDSLKTQGHLYTALFSGNGEGIFVCLFMLCITAFERCKFLSIGFSAPFSVIKRKAPGSKKMGKGNFQRRLPPQSRSSPSSFILPFSGGGICFLGLVILLSLYKLPLARSVIISAVLLAFLVSVVATVQDDCVIGRVNKFLTRREVGGRPE